MNKPTFTHETWNDAGLLREYTAARYGAALCYGAMSETMARADKMVRRISKLTGRGVMGVIADIRADYTYLETEEDRRAAKAEQAAGIAEKGEDEIERSRR